MEQIAYAMVFVISFFTVRCVVAYFINNAYANQSISLIPTLENNKYEYWNVLRFIFIDLHLWTLKQVVKAQNSRPNKNLGIYHDNQGGPPNGFNNFILRMVFYCSVGNQHHSNNRIPSRIRGRSCLNLPGGNRCG